MTDRPRRDQLTDDMLDQLYGWLDTARAVARAEQKRANQAEAELVVSREVARSNRRHVRAIVPELEKAEAAIARVRALADQWAILRAHGSAAAELRAALDGTA